MMASSFEKAAKRGVRKARVSLGQRPPALARLYVAFKLSPSGFYNVAHQHVRVICHLPSPWLRYTPRQMNFSLYAALQ